MNPRKTARILKLINKNNLKISLLWIDVKYFILQKILTKTSKFRIKLSKKLIIKSEFLKTDKSTWDDIEVQDQWGLWLPLGFGICSYLDWKNDDDFNIEHGLEREEFKNTVKSKHWTTYYSKEEYLTLEHYIDSTRKHLSEKLGKTMLDKQLELILPIASQKYLDEKQLDYLNWVQNGMKPFKIVITDSAKEDLKKIGYTDDQIKELESKENENS